ncbi:heparinase II/III family protein [Acinetobacter baumannii]|uniref:heparinase II/III domain-containing protein n=1 Tax=Acinetobacter baumannii TaxID=470 RepID=UPI0015801E6B|nr:heparinase II/III family protein [Acinetobacter baumannii]MDW3028005.1 heparinase II/III family protein [Acinetobacter baumannii]NUG30388.1 alginate lyase family protein [Acinetobacter baumannii]
MGRIVKAQTALALGLFNLFRVFKYRIGVKTGLNPVQKLSAQFPTGCFFTQNTLTEQIQDPEISTLTAFGYLKYPLAGQVPDWFYSPLTQHTFQNTEKPWYQIPDFDENVGDIKGIWEASRFDWLIELVSKERHVGDGRALVQLDLWLNDWCKKNPAYFGPNWKCGQEASIRVMHIITALIGLGQEQHPHDNVCTFIETHLKRIEPTIDYAIAQDNNHGTSEAAALYIGGAVLNLWKPKPQYQQWQVLGEKWLINRANKLIMSDGGFSQYSINYHRVMLDSYCLAEIVRQKFELKPFSGQLYRQLQKATDWLYVLTQADGDVPNLGANDGARLIPVSQTDYRDFRPTVQLASTLFHQHSYYPEPDSYDESLIFFQIQKLKQQNFELPSRNQFFNESGLITAQNHNFFIAFKLPKFKFRPSQCDGLHLDVWFKGQNILRDGGTYSYNSSPEDLEYFSGVASHNTVEFDKHQQMPRLSRFLFGAWLTPKNLTYKPYEFGCGYQDYWQCKHHRKVLLTDNQIEVVDNISGFQQQAILRWRLQPDHWVLNNNILTNGKVEIILEAEHSISIHLTEGEESRYYYQKTKLPVLEITAIQPTTIFTVIKDIT